MSRLSDPPEPEENALPPITPHRAMCNRLVLEEAVRSYDREHGRGARRETEPPEQEGSAVA